MAFALPASAFLLLQLSLLLLLTSITVSSTDETLMAHDPPAQAPRHHHHHHHHSSAPTPSPIYPPTKPPTHSPVKPPVHPPVKPPVHPPVKPPVHPPVKPPVKPPVTPPAPPPVKPPSYPLPRKMVVIRGVVFCKSCKYRGVDTLVAAAPLAGAVVKLECNNTKYPLREQTKTDKNGFFFFMPQKLTTAGSHKCKVMLGSSPLPNCGVPTSLHSGAAGAILMPTPDQPKDSKLMYFTVGPFAFEPHKKLPCH